MASDTPSSPTAESGSAGPELRLLDRRAFIGFPPIDLTPGVRVTDFGLQIPDVTFPFNLSGGPLRYQKRTLQFGFLEVSVEAAVLQRAVQALTTSLFELEDVSVQPRAGHLEGQARLRTPLPVDVTFKVALDADGERLAVYLYEVRIYGFSPTPSAVVPLLLSRAAQHAGALPDIEVRGANGFSARVLPGLVQHAALSRGFRMPSLDGARLTGLEVAPEGLRLRFASSGVPPPSLLDEELLLTLEGARAFAEPEALVAAGRLAEARQGYLRSAEPQEAHPFAVERLLGLLVADPSAHELALDVAAALAQRRPSSAAPLWAEAVVRERRGEPARAAERWLALSAVARKRREEASAFAAAQAAVRCAEGRAPQLAVKALHELLGLRPDHLPSLQTLARAADAAGDRAGAIRAYRRLSALSRDPVESADAHVSLARLSALTEDDIAGARLHAEAALKLAPDHPAALELLGELCHRGADPLRALKALDRLRDVALGRHDLETVGRANLLAGRVWEEGLRQLDNALLRYREAAALLPANPIALASLARVADGLGRTSEAVAGYLQAVELAGAEPVDPDVRAAVHAAHHALALAYRSRLGDPARARSHLEAALGLDPSDGRALDALIPDYRASGAPEPLARALESAAQLRAEPGRRAAFLAEAGELQRTRLGAPEAADRLFRSAIEADPHQRTALEGMLALAEARRDGPTLARCLRALADLAREPAERVRFLRRLAVAAKDLLFDLELAAEALAEVLRAEPDDLLALGELCALQRKRSDMPGLAEALAQRASTAESQKDLRLAAACLRELGQVLDTRLGRTGEALVALEKAARLAPETAVLLDLADLSLRCERPDHARRALEDALRGLPGHTPPQKVAEVRAKLGRACELLADNEEAVVQYAAAFPFRPGDDGLAERLETLYEQLGKRRELAELWSTRAQTLIAAGRTEPAAPLLFKGARSLLEGGHRESAHRQLYAALEMAPRGRLAAEILEQLAELELAEGNRPEAAQLLARQAALLSEPHAAARLFARAASLASDPDREVSFLDEALRQDPALATAHVRRAALVLARDPARALEDLEAAMHLARVDPGLLPESERSRLAWRAAEAARSAGRPDAARRHLVAHCVEHPEDLEAQLALAAVHRASGALDALASLLAELWPKLSGEQARAACRELVELSLELERPGEVLAALRHLVALDTGDTWAAKTLLEVLPPPEGAAAVEHLSLLDRVIALERGPSRARARVARARLQRAQGRRGEAREDLAAAAEEAEAPGPLFRELAALAAEDGDAHAELDAWRAALKSDLAFAGEAAARLLALGRAGLERRDHTFAREAFAAGLEVAATPEQLFDGHSGVAEAALASGDSSEASAALLRAAAQGPVPRRLEALFRRADLAEEASDRSGLVESLERALLLSPRHPAALGRLQAALRQAGDFAGLAELLAADAARAPRTEAARLWLEVGALYADVLELPGPAEVALRRAVHLAPREAPGRERLLGLLLVRGAWAEAAELALESEPLLGSEPAAQLLEEAAELCDSAGASAASLALRRRAHARVSASGPALRALAEALYLAGSGREAAPLVAAAAASADFLEDPERDEALLLAHAELAEAAGAPEAAEASLRKILNRRPTSRAALERLAGLLFERRPREAVELLAGSLERRAPTPRTGEELRWLAERAALLLADPELVASLLGKAAERVLEPGPVYAALAALHRDSGRDAELLEALRTLAEAQRAAEDAEGLQDTLRERVDVAERLGRGEEALATLAALRELVEQAGQPVEAATLERRRAGLLLELRRDAFGAEAALRRSFALHPDVSTAEQAAALAARREDVRAQVDWLERAVPLRAVPVERADALVALSVLHEGPLEDAARAEALLREALAVAPGHPGAEALLVPGLERSGRNAELAFYFASAARHRAEPGEAVQLYRRASALFRDRLADRLAAIGALTAALALAPNDPATAGELAQLLEEEGRTAEAGAFDAVVLAADPFAEPAWTRAQGRLSTSRDWTALAALHLARAERQAGAEAAISALSAARALREAGQEEAAREAEDRAFEIAPDSDAAFAARRARVEHEPRALADLLFSRAAAVPTQAPELLAERAERLLQAREPVLAAEAWDDLLRLRPDDVRALLARGDLAAQAGGPGAAQPYDRRLLAVAEADLPTPVRVRTRLRLGHAALASGALQDAGEAFESVVELDPESERGREALSLLSEVYGRRQDGPGLFRTTVRLAQGAEGAESEALYRRAAELFEDPSRSLEALLPLFELRPAEPSVVDRAARGLAALGRHEELLALCARGAEAAGGPRAAELLLQAAQVARESLGDQARAMAFTEAARSADPENVGALTWLSDEYRRRGDAPALLGSLRQLLSRSDGTEDSDAVRLEAAQVAAQLGDAGTARALLEEVVQRGPAGPRYADALTTLLPLLDSAQDALPRAAVLAAQGELLAGPSRSTALLEAARLADAGGDPARAAEWCRAAVAAVPSHGGLLLLSSLFRRAGELGKAAACLAQAAQLGPPQERARLLLDAADAWEAAGDPAEAEEVLERVARLHPELLPPADWAERFARLAAPEKAVRYGFAPLMAAGEYAAALSVADALGDPAHAREALRAAAQVGAEPDQLRRLGALLLAEGALPERLHVAYLAESASALDMATALYRSVLRGAPSEAETALRIQAFERLSALEDPHAVLAAEVGETAPSTPLGWADTLISAARARRGEVRERLLRQLATRVPARAASLWEELFGRARDDNRLEDATAALSAWVDATPEREQRAGLRLQLGDLLLHLGRPAEAREAYAASFEEDPTSVHAAQKLLAMTSAEQEPARFVRLCELLSSYLGPDAVAAEREVLVGAYQALGRPADAYASLSLLEPTAELTARRAALAEELGNLAESVALRERLARTPEEREALALTAARAGLFDQAAAVAVPLGRAGTLSAGGRRELAERLADAESGASASAELWPEVLAAAVLDPEGWALFAVALRHTARTGAAERAEAFAAVAAGEAPSPRPVVLSPLRRPAVVRTVPLPLEAMPISLETMPRLHAVLSAALSSLGAPEVRVHLDPAGGPEAWLAGPDTLVLGAGALTRFGPDALAFLLALALQLGEEGALLVAPGPVEALVEAASEAFVAVPAPAAAARVLTWLEAEARGADPETVDAQLLLSGSRAFRAVASRAVTLG